MRPSCPQWPLKSCGVLSCPIPLLFPIAGIALAGTLSGLNPTTARPLGTSEPPQLASQPSTTGGHAASNPPKPTPQPPTPTEGFAPGGGLPALPASLVEKIRGGSFVDLGDLLPEHVFEAFVDGDDKEKKSHEIETFQEWVLGYTIWASTIVASNPERGLSSLQYLGVIGRLARDNPTHVWRHYDKQFRQMAAAVPTSAQWGELNFQFLQWAKQKDPYPTQLREACRRWNEGRFCQFSTCKREHSCSSCGKPHRAVAYPTTPVPYLPPRGTWVPHPGQAPPLQPHTAAADSQKHTNLRP